MDNVVNRAIAIIPARGGSKRIPRKNIVPFNGKPLIAWTIEAARATGLFDTIHVSTDSDEIARLSEALGCDVPFLRPSHADDLSPVSQATIVALQEYRRRLSREWEVVAQLMPNCPLRNAADISDALAAFASRGRTFQISAFRFGWMNPWWAHTVDMNGVPTPLLPEGMGKRSQDLPPVFCPTGAIWVARCAELESAGTFYGAGFQFHELPWASAVDIDTHEDLEMAQAVYALRTTGSVA